MEKRTSDFMALTAIVGGAGIGLGLTSLFLLDGAPVAQMDDVSVEIHVVQRANVSTAVARAEHFAVILTGEQDYRPVTEFFRFRTDLDGLELEYRETLEGLEGSLKALEELEGLEALEELEGLEGLQSLRFDIFQRDEDEDQRRRRRRRRPRAPDASGN